MSGGWTPEGNTQGIDSVEYYDISSDQWSFVPANLIEPRAFHSSCALGDWIYVMFGRTVDGEFLNSFERLDAKLLAEGYTSGW